MVDHNSGSLIAVCPACPRICSDWNYALRMIYNWLAQCPVSRICPLSLSRPCALLLWLCEYSARLDSDSFTTRPSPLMIPAQFRPTTTTNPPARRCLGPATNKHSHQSPSLVPTSPTQRYSLSNAPLIRTLTLAEDAGDERDGQSNPAAPILLKPRLKFAAHSSQSCGLLSVQLCPLRCAGSHPGLSVPPCSPHTLQFCLSDYQIVLTTPASCTTPFHWPLLQMDAPEKVTHQT